MVLEANCLLYMTDGQSYGAAVRNYLREETSDAWIPSGCCSPRRCAHFQVACQRDEHVCTDLKRFLRLAELYMTRRPKLRTQNYLRRRTKWSVDSFWMLNPRGCAHLQVACQQKLGAAGQAGFPLCPEFWP